MTMTRAEAIAAVESWKQSAIRGGGLVTVAAGALDKLLAALREPEKDLPDCELKAAAEYCAPVRYGCDRDARYGGIRLSPDAKGDVWDVLHSLLQAHRVLADTYLKAQPPPSQPPGPKPDMGLDALAQSLQETPEDWPMKSPPAWDGEAFERSVTEAAFEELKRPHGGILDSAQRIARRARELAEKGMGGK